MICITETWCSNDSFQNNSNFNLTNYRAIHLGRKEKRGGGVCVFVHEQYMFKTRKDLSISNDENEHLCIEIINKQRKNIIVNTCYRPPGSKVKPFKKHVASVFNQVKRENKKKIFVGDLNINSLDYSSNSVVRNFINDILSYGAIPLINKPTRITKKSVTCLDHIYINSLGNQKLLSGIIKTDLSDHLPVFVVDSNINAKKITKK